MSESKERYTESVGASVSPELKRKIRIAAAKEDLSMSTFIREILQEAMEDKEI